MIFDDTFSFIHSFHIQYIYLLYVDELFLLKTKVILHLFLQPQGREEWTHEYRHLFYSCIKIHCVENPSQKNPKTNYLQIENTWMFLSMCFSSLSLPQTKPQQPFRNRLTLTMSSIYINLLLGIKSNTHRDCGGSVWKVCHVTHHSASQDRLHG